MFQISFKAMKTLCRLAPNVRNCPMYCLKARFNFSFSLNPFSFTFWHVPMKLRLENNQIRQLVSYLRKAEKCFFHLFYCFSIFRNGKVISSTEGNIFYFILLDSRFLLSSTFACPVFTIMQDSSFSHTKMKG